MKKFLQVLLYILGFPLLIGLLVWKNFDIIKGGLSYGIYVFVGIIIVAVFGLIYMLTMIINAKKGKKKGKPTLYRQTFTAMILCFCMLGGFWMVVDVAVPDLLADATSSTVWYEDLADDYQSRADVNKGLLDEFIKRNYDVNALSHDKTLEDYQKEGVKNEKVLELLNIKFKSIDSEGYQAFDKQGPWLAFALDNRMTIPDLMHLLLDDRTITPVEYYTVDSKGKVSNAPVGWNILDMLGTPMEVDLSGIIPAEGLDLGGIPVSPKLIGLAVSAISNAVANATGDDGLLGSPIYLSFDGKTSALVITPSNEKKGVLDYQSMAWLNSNGLLYAVVTFFSTRKLFLLFAGWMVLNNLFIGLLRGMGKELKGIKAVKGKGQGNNGAAVKKQPPLPYSYFEVDEKRDLNAYDVINMRRAIIEDSRKGVARRYTPGEYR